MQEVEIWALIPFALMLLGIAICPFVIGEWWEKNGATAIHRVDDPDVWEVDDWLVYDGPIRYARFRQEEI